MFTARAHRYGLQKSWQILLFISIQIYQSAHIHIIHFTFIIDMLNKATPDPGYNLLWLRNKSCIAISTSYSETFLKSVIHFCFVTGKCNLPTHNRRLGVGIGIS